MKARLTEILDAIKSFYLYDDDTAHKYISLTEETVDIMRDIETNATSMLDNARNDAVYELSNELAGRMNDAFFHANLERKKDEFKISKMLATVAIGNVLSLMPDK